jgi:hypothetical protein
MSVSRAAPGRPEPAGASRQTRLVLVASKPAQAGWEPRYSLPSGGRSRHCADEALS